MYGLLGEKNSAPAADANTFEFRPLGLGVQDIPSLLAASKDAGALWIVIEQDKPSMGKTPIECAEISIKNLRSAF